MDGWPGVGRVWAGCRQGACVGALGGDGACRGRPRAGWCTGAARSERRRRRRRGGRCCVEGPVASSSTARERIGAWQLTAHGRLLLPAASSHRLRQQGRHGSAPAVGARRRPGVASRGQQLLHSRGCCSHRGVGGCPCRVVGLTDPGHGRQPSAHTAGTYGGAAGLTQPGGSAARASTAVHDRPRPGQQVLCPSLHAPARLPSTPARRSWWLRSGYPGLPV